MTYEKMTTKFQFAHQILLCVYMLQWLHLENLLIHNNAILASGGRTFTGGGWCPSDKFSENTPGQPRTTPDILRTNPRQGFHGRKPPPDVPRTHVLGKSIAFSNPRTFPPDTPENVRRFVTLLLMANCENSRLIRIEFL